MQSRRTWIRTTAEGAAGCLCLASTSSGAAEAVPPDRMVIIPAGPFLMGTTQEDAQRLAREYGYDVSWLGGETPQRRLELPGFAIDTYPVTNRQFARYCEATDARPPRMLWRGKTPPDRLLDHPVIFVDHATARAYAKWAGKRLPTEAEWEKAARGPDGRLFPWGSRFEPDACQWNRDRTDRGPGTARVDAHPGGASVYGVMDMVGNVAEWCQDGPGPSSRAIKGGCWLTEVIINLRPACRTMSGFPNNRSAFYGFRCAKDVD